MCGAVHVNTAVYVAVNTCTAPSDSCTVGGVVCVTAPYLGHVLAVKRRGRRRYSCGGGGWRGGGGQVQRGLVDAASQRGGREECVREEGSV